MGNRSSPGARGNSGHARTNIPNAAEERNYGGSPEFYCNVFLVCKSSEGWRPVIDLKSLNAHIFAPHFHMFTKSIRKRKLRVQDRPAGCVGHFHVPIHLSRRKYLRFAFDGNVYQC